jgi:hypothetical protein
MARPKKTLDDKKFSGWEQLDALIVWSTQAYCCEKLGITEKTLTKLIREKTGLSFSQYKDQKKEPLRINLLKKQYDVAMSGNVSMLIWLGKQHLGQSDKNDTKVNVEKFEFVGED